MRASSYRYYVEQESELRLIEARIKGLEKEIAQMIRRMEPPDARGQQYDRPAVQNGFHVNEELQVMELMAKQSELDNLKIRQMISKQTFEEMCRIFDEARQKTRSDRQLEVFMLWREGKDNREIAQIMYIDVRTVENYKTAINAILYPAHMVIAELSANDNCA